MSGWRERLAAVLGREAADLSRVRREAEERLDAELDRRERDLAATPEERLDSTLGDISASDEEFDRLRRRLDGDR